MEAQEALVYFLSHALIESKRDRYIGFASKRKTRGKFLNAIYHDLESCFDQRKKVSYFSRSVLKLTGYRYEPSGLFGEPIDSIGEVCNEEDESFLVISSDGKYGIHGPETFIDSRAYYCTG